MIRKDMSMNMQDMLSMMGGQDMGNMMSMLSKFTGNKVNRDQIRKQMDMAFDKMNDVFLDGMISMLYKEYPTESLGSLFKSTEDREEKVKVLSSLVTKAAPSVLEKMNDTDLDKLYQVLQRKRG